MKMRSKRKTEEIKSIISHKHHSSMLLMTSSPVMDTAFIIELTCRFYKHFFPLFVGQYIKSAILYLKRNHLWIC